MYKTACDDCVFRILTEYIEDDTALLELMQSVEARTKKIWY